MLNKIQCIQIWRILACVMVFTVHLGQRMGLTGVMYAFTDFGKYGVYLFFLISGFLACYSVDAQSNKTRYWLKRCTKILPLYYGVIMFYYVTETFIFKSIPNDPTGLRWMRYIFFLSGFVKGEGYFWTNLGITWTIPIFVLFYIIYPFLSKKLSTFYNSLIGLLISLILGLLISNYADGNLLAFTYIPFFMLGINLYYALKENKLDMAMFFCALGMLFMIIFGVWNYEFLYSLIFIILIISSRNIEIKNPTLMTVINVLDKYTYTVYLAHGIIFCNIIDKIELNPLCVFIIAIVGTVLLTYLIFNFWEKPIQKKLNNIFRLK